jgi:hypothetical protein
MKGPSSPWTCVEIKIHVAFASTSTPSTRRLLDGVAMPVLHRSTEPGRSRHFYGAPDAPVDLHTAVDVAVREEGRIIEIVVRLREVVEHGAGLVRRRAVRAAGLDHGDDAYVQRLDRIRYDRLVRAHHRPARGADVHRSECEVRARHGEVQRAALAAV